MNNAATLQARYELASLAIRDAEANGRSRRVLSKLYKALFAAEDAARAAGVW